MKLLKKSLFLSIFVLLTALSLAVFCGANNKETASAALQNHNFMKYMKISSATELSDNNVIKNGNYDYSIISNNTISILPNLFEYRFDFSNTDFSNFNVSYSEKFILEENEGNLEITFNGVAKTYYYKIVSNKLSIHNSIISSAKIKDIENDYKYGIAYNSRTREMSYIKTITYTFNSPEETLNLKILDGTTYSFSFNFLKPITKFTDQDEPIVKFNCFGQDAGNNPSGYNPTWLPSERIYKNVTIKFFKNYTEKNPLFFNINLNGFTYYYKIFIKDNILNLVYQDANDTVTKTYNIFENQLSEENTFDIKFSEIGRYQLEFYDLTYNPNISKEENYRNSANYYSTSFYIYDNTKTFENIYLVAESYIDGVSNGFIVSNSSQTATLNNDIRATFKNLYFLSETNIKKVKITVTKTLFTGSVSSTTTEYTYENNAFMAECYDNKKDFYVDLTDDARYKINVYFDNNINPIITTSYEVVKLPKTLFQVGNEGDPYYDRYVEEKPFTKTEKSYEVPLSSQTSLNISYKNINGDTVVESKENSTFRKTYINKFKIFFGISQINIGKYKRIIKQGSEESVATTLDIRIDAVGSVTVTVTYNGERTTYQFSEKENKVLSFSNYGTYKIHVVDEMGTTKTATFSYEKSLNTSALLLIALSSILVLGIVIFILRSRSKLATR